MRSFQVAVVVLTLAGPGTAAAGPITIDFETLPNGTSSTLGGLIGDSYAPWGVSFWSLGVSDMPVFSAGYDADGYFAGSWHADYSVASFNIVADFAIPVYAVSVEVMTAAGVNVTMKAFDIHNVLIGSVTSLNAPSTYWAGTLSLASGTPIARLEWGSSDQFASVGIDNLSFAPIPEPATLLLLGTGLGAVAARRRLKKRA